MDEGSGWRRKKGALEEVRSVVEGRFEKRIKR